MKKRTQQEIELHLALCLMLRDNINSIKEEVKLILNNNEINIEQKYYEIIFAIGTIQPKVVASLLDSQKFQISLQKSLDQDTIQEVCQPPQ